MHDYNHFKVVKFLVTINVLFFILIMKEFLKVNNQGKAMFLQVITNHTEYKFPNLKENILFALLKY